MNTSFTSVYPENPPKDFNEWFAYIIQCINPNKPAKKHITALWIDTPVMTSRTYTRRIEEGDFIMVQDGRLKDCKGKPTHRITGCYEKTEHTAAQISIIDLNTLELSTINL